jgi:hypothetical protein
MNKMIVYITDTGFSAFSENNPIYTTGMTISELIDNAFEAANLFFFQKITFALYKRTLSLKLILNSSSITTRSLTLSFLPARLG